MGIRISEADCKPAQPTPKKVTIGRWEGVAEPRVSREGTKVTWFLWMEGPGDSRVLVSRISAHGYSVRKAVGELLIGLRHDIACRTEWLAELEAELPELAGKGDDEIRRLLRYV